MPWYIQLAFALSLCVLFLLVRLAVPSREQYRARWHRRCRMAMNHMVNRILGVRGVVGLAVGRNGCDKDRPFAVVLSLDRSILPRHELALMEHYVRGHLDVPLRVEHLDGPPVAVALDKTILQGVE